MSQYDLTTRENEAVKGRIKWLREQGRKNKLLREKAYNRYIVELKNGATDAEARKTICEIFDLTPKRFQNIVDRRSELVNPKLAIETDAMVYSQIHTMLKNVESSIEECDDELEKLAEMEESGTDWGDIEQSETTGGKNAGTTTKRLPISKLRIGLLQQKVNLGKDFFSALKTLLPKHIILDSGEGLQRIHDDELEARMAEMGFKKEDKIQDAEYTVEKGE